MKQFYFLFITLFFSIPINAQDERERLNWTESCLFQSLKECCKKDYTIKDSTVFRILDKYNISVEEIYPTYFDMEGLAFKNHTLYLARYELLCSDEIKKGYSKDRFNNLYFFLKKHLSKKSVEQIYGDILRLNLDDYAIPYSREDLSAYYNQDINTEIVKELQSLHSRWNEITTNFLWEKYVLSQSKKFKEVANKIDSVLNIRNNRKYKDGVLKKTYNTGSKIQAFKLPYTIEEFEIPYKVVNNELVADGLGKIHFNKKQYPGATGGNFKSVTCDINVYINFKNGVATSKSIKGFVWNWEADQKVFDRAYGSYKERMAKMNKAKPVLVRTINVEKVDDPDLIVTKESIESLLKFNYITDASLAEHCKFCFKNPYPYRFKDDLEQILVVPFKQVDLSNVFR